METSRTIEIIPLRPLKGNRYYWIMFKYFPISWLGASYILTPILCIRTGCGQLHLRSYKAFTCTICTWPAPLLYNMEMEINIENIQLMIFSRSKIRNIPNFTYNGSAVLVVFSCRYLRIDLNYNGKFNQWEKHLFNQAQKAPCVLNSYEREKIRFASRLAITLVWPCYMELKYGDIKILILLKNYT